MEPVQGEVTTLLQAWAAGDRSVESRLFDLVVPDLRRLADALMRKERPGHSLEATALLDEVYCRLVTANERDFENRRHFFAVAARAMRHLLVDHARARPKGREVTLKDLTADGPAMVEKFEMALAIDGLLDDLKAVHPDWCSVIELRFFMGLTEEETADATGWPLRSVQRKFGDARRWLFEKLQAR